MDVLVERYKKWLDRVVGQLHCARGAEGRELLARFQSLTLHEDSLGAYHHMRVLGACVSSFSEDYPDLLWARKLASDLRSWREAISADLSIKGADEFRLVESVMSNASTIDEAIDLLQVHTYAST